MRKILFALVAVAGLTSAGAVSAATLDVPFVTNVQYYSGGYGYNPRAAEWREREWRHHEWERHRRWNEERRWHEYGRSW